MLRMEEAAEDGSTKRCCSSLNDGVVSTMDDMEKRFGQLERQVQEAMMNMKAKEKDLEFQRIVLKRKEEELMEQLQQLQNDRLDMEKEREMERANLKDTKEKFDAKELMLKNMEKDLQGKFLAAETLASKLNARESALENYEKQCKEERFQLRELMGNLEAEKKAVETAKMELEMSKRSIDEARSCIKLQIEKDTIDRQRLQIQEAMMNVEAQGKDLEFQRLLLKRKEERLKEQLHQVQDDKLNMEKEIEMARASLKATQEKLDAKELMLKNTEKDLQEKFIVADTLASKLNARESVLENLEKQCEEERLQTRELMANLEAEKKVLEAAKVELELSKRSVDEAWSCISAERDEAAEYIISVDKKMKIWEDRLKERENEVLKQREFLRIFETQVRQEQDQCHMLRTNYKKDQEKRAHELSIWEDDVKKRQMDVEREEEKVRKDRQILKEERNIAEEKLKQAKELKARTETLEQELNVHYYKSLQEAKRQEQEYQARFGAIEDLKHDLEKKSVELDRKFEELRARKKELKIWRRKAQEAINKQINLLWKEHLACESLQGTRNMESHEMKPERQLNNGEHAENVEDDTLLDVGKGIFEIQKERSENRDKVQQETARLAQERESLKAQQHELEEIRKAVQDAKSTLATQLNASKKMVVDASLTAQRASRERGALEEERKCLVKFQKEMGTVLSAREAKIALEEEKLERIREAVEKEKADASDVILKAEQMKKVVGRVDRERDKIFCLPENNAVMKALCQTSLDGHGKKMFNLFNNPLHTDCKHLDNNTSEVHDRSLWRKQQHAMIGKEENLVNDLHHFPLKDEYTFSREEFPSSAQLASFPDMMMTERDRQMICQGKIEGKLETPEIPDSKTFMYDASAPATCTLSESFLRHQEDSPESIDQPRQLSEFMQDNHTSFFEEDSPSQKRLENVMTSLLNARMASRNRLQRTENLLATLPSEPASEIRVALKALAQELTSMEKVEEELSDQLKEAYNTRSPDPEGVIVDKMQLLCRMEEQQKLRTEWEKQMQHQLEKINMLQTNAFESSAFNTQIMQATLHDLSSPSSNGHSPKVMYSEDCYGQSHGILSDADIERVNTQTVVNHLNEMHLFEETMFPDWSKDLETYHVQFSGNLSKSSLMPHAFHRSSSNHGHVNSSPKELTYERNARRRLLLPKSKGAYN